MDPEISLKAMILAFRVTELQTLLSYAGKNRSGRKNELQARAMELMKSNKSAVNAKIRELYNSIQLSTSAQPAPASAGIVNTGGATASQLQQRASAYNSWSGPNRMAQTGAGVYTGAAEKVLLGRNPYSNSGYPSISVGGVNRLAAGLQTINTPICPDVQLKKLPFYDILSVLYKPTTLLSAVGVRGIQDNSFTFSFKPSEASEIASSKELNLAFTGIGDNKMQYGVQVQLRFCLADANGGDQDDAFPSSLVVKVNGKMIQLPPPIPSNRPGVEPKRPSKPLNITNVCKLSPTVSNQIQVNWAPDPAGKSYCISLYMVKRLYSKDLLGRLKAKGPRPADFTRGMIKEICQKDDADCCVATTTLKVSLACPLGKSRMAIPCRASTCSHLQCFDANLFIQMNEKKPIWVCPVCDKATLFDNLAIDGYFEDIISKVPIEEGNDIEISPDAEWSVAVRNDEPPAKKSRTVPPRSANKTICLDDDIVAIDDDDSGEGDDSNSASAKTGAGKENNKPIEKPKPPFDIVDLTLSSTEDEEEEEEMPPAPAPPVSAKSPTKKPDYETAPAAPLPPKKIVDDRETAPLAPLKEKKREREREKSPAKMTSHQDNEDGEVKGSSTDDEEEDNIRPVRRMPNRQARPTFLHDESSSGSNSNSSDSSASTRAPDSPQCITLESDSSSRTLSPEPRLRRRESRDSSRGKRTTTTSQHGGGVGGSSSSSHGHNSVVNSFLSSGSVFAGAGGSSSSQQQAASSAAGQPTAAAAAGSNNYSTSSSYPNSTALPNPRYAADGHGHGNYSHSVSGGYQSGAAYRAANAAAASNSVPLHRQPPLDPYVSGSYGYEAWNPSFGISDFDSLDFPSMDYFNQGPSYGSGGTGPSYNGRGGGFAPHWR